MRKISKAADQINSVNEIISLAKKRGIVHLFTEDDYFNGKHITINGKKLLNFGSCSYIGLETDFRLKEAAIEAVKRYGTQFSSSRAYVSFTLYEELEELLGKMFNAPIILSPNTSLGHQAVIPIILDDRDAVIMDHQAHISMQDTLQKLQVRGITTTLVRHSRLDELERKIKELGPKHHRIWYFVDGVYSMYGDLSPIDSLVKLLNKYQQLYLYADDAHGMSWTGKNGTGYILSKFQLHPRLILSTSLAKGFASAGGVFIITDPDLYWRVKNWGGPLTYSGPQQPAVIGASVASAKIHLSDEIYERQQTLAEKIKYCNEVLEGFGLPVIRPSISPIFYIGLGLTKVGYNLVRRLMDDGIYVNLGIFPAVPETCTGVRFTLTHHHHLNDIDHLAKILAYHLPKALKEEGRSINDIYRAFRSVTDFKNVLKKDTPLNTDIQPKFSPYVLTYSNTIKDIDKSIWNKLFENKGAFDWNSLNLMESIFINNEKREENWSFHYYLIKDSKTNKPVLATLFTCALIKNDMLSPSIISKNVEDQRLKQFYYLTSKAMMMGTLITEGQHLYLDRDHPNWKQVVMLLLDEVWIEQEKQKAPILYLRDFPAEDIALQEFFMDQGFIKMNMPDSHVVNNLNFDSMEDYLSELGAKKRGHIKRDVLKFSNYFKQEIINEMPDSQLDHLYQLYRNVSGKNLEINSFLLPKKFFKHIIKSSAWEVIILKIKEDSPEYANDLPVAVVWSYQNIDYFPTLIGLDYNFLHNVKVYKQILYRILARALELKCQKINFGLTASLEKRKLGAQVKKQVAYIQMKDHYDMSLVSVEGIQSN